MPINKIVPTTRGKAAIAAALIAAAAGGWQSYKDTSARVLPPAVILATDALILPWEGMVLTSHWDQFAKIYDICAGITRINGKPVGPNMRFTRTQCEEMTREQIYNDYYLPLVKAVPGYTSFPIGVQAAMLSGAYNFGVNGMVRATATRLHRLAHGMQAHADAAEAEASKAKDADDLVLAASKMAEANRLRAAAASQYRRGCEAQTAWNKAGGQVVNGLVKRREMGDAQRKGEAEICVSGL
jgi:GH24 family phage-related lysozyme (muramidase)